MAQVVRSVTVRYFGPPGGNTPWFYWVQALYTHGYSALSPYGLIGNSRIALNRDGYNVVTWSPVEGAICYKIWRTPTSDSPTSGPYMLAQVSSSITSLTDDGINWQPTNDTVVAGIDISGDANITGTYYSNGVPISGGGGGGAVTSVFGRSGSVVAQAGDYNASQVTNAVDATSSYANPSWIANLAWSKITGAPAITVSSVFGRTGAIVAQAGDYTAAQVGAVPTTRQVLTGTGLVGGGALSADLSLSVVADTTNQQIQALHGASVVATRHALNFNDTASATWTIADNPSANRIDISVVAAATGGGLSDPTTTLGDLLVRGSSTVQRLGVGTNGQVLTANSGAALGVQWSVPSSAPVSSVFGRTGVVVAASGDYTAAQVTNAVDQTGSYVNPAWITSLPYSKITGAPSIPVTSVFTRTGAVVAATGDYTAAQVTNAVDQSQTYANPTWITSLAWPKITGAPSVGSYQTPWLQNIDGGGFYLSHVGSVGIGGSFTAPAYPLDVWGTGVFRPSAGGTASTQVFYDSAGVRGGIQAYDTSSSTFKTMLVIGNPLVLNQGGQGPVSIGNQSPGPYTFEISGRSVSTSQVHISYDGTDTGGYLYVGPAGGMNISAGIASINGTLIAKATGYTYLSCGLGNWILYLGSGATVGSAVTLGTPTIYASGANVGIGTTSPGHTLDVNGSIRSNVTTGGNFIFPADSGYEWWIGEYSDASSFEIVRRNTSGSPWNCPLAISTGGNVGIGVTNPLALLHAIVGGTGPQIVARFANSDSGVTTSEPRVVFDEGGGGWYQGIGAPYNNGNPSLTFSATTSAGSWAERMRITSAGLVGIGTASPTSKLQVVGLPTYASDSAAGTGGLTSGAFYADASGGLHVKL